MEIPTNEQMNFAKRILGYTKGTIKNIYMALRKEKHQHIYITIEIQILLEMFLIVRALQGKSSSLDL